MLILVLGSEVFHYMKKCEVQEARYQQERRRNCIYLGFDLVFFNSPFDLVTYERNKFNFQITPLLSLPSTVLNAWILFSFNEFKIKEGSTHSSNPSLNPFFLHLVLMFMYLLFIKFLCQYFVHFLCLRGECVSWHGRVKVGEATSSRYEDIKNTFDQVTITEQHSC